MKLNKLGNLLVIGLMVTCAVCGCRKKPVAVTPIPQRPPGQVGDVSPGRPIEPARETVGYETPSGIPISEVDRTGWREDAEMFKSETVYFDFDSSAIKPGERPKIQTVATYMKANPRVAVRVEGHCDERGTIEYNRALGERRALAIREELVRLGIAPDRISTISYGEERPVDPGHNEEAWRKNRRGEFVILTPP
ncbi:MAG: peptidoglycan-associated lipoprotein Pal [Verrucomicrobiae bacterium]|nr:peptidoglycan-associated lipoprotein Pal [Verrucomicrobiae bacterium]MDW7980513.1 peptidoglycan-associated lipoprotein Pal [Verrucomicrobiales bacterium]